MVSINISNVDGKSLGFISSSYVCSKVFYKDFFNSVRNFFGWELISYTQMVDIARDKVIERLKEKAVSIGANSICNLKFEVSYMSNGSLAIMGYADAKVIK
jgi:uncharacterized protein YbjQ (UPF0145 family)